MTTNTLITESHWKDGKRWLWVLSPALPLIALLCLLLVPYTDIGIFYWAGPLLLYGLIPIVDWLVGTDRTNPPESAVAQLEEDLYYRVIVYAYIPTQYLVTIYGTWLAVTAGPVWWEMIGLIMTVGVVNGISINTAHELGHKKGALERWLAKVTLAPVAYGHFFVEHNKGHHKNVATPEDPASSRMGETFWAFLPRTMIGSVQSAWEIEKTRLARLDKGPWTLENENIQAWLMTVALFSVLTLTFGWAGLAFLLVQAFYGASLLEVVNYLEHYGLLRQKEDSGRYERCQPRHSWNSNHIITNLFLYQLQRHSDHHANPTRRFQALRHFDDSPQLPSGYASMILIAYIPPLWFRQMDPLVAKHYQGDLTQANIHEPARQRLMERWHEKRLDDGNPEIFPGAKKSARNEDDSRPSDQTGFQQFECTDCGYIYDEAKGCEHEGFAPGTRWADIPQDWACPDCAVRDKPDFRSLNTASAD